MESVNQIQMSQIPEIPEIKDEELENEFWEIPSQYRLIVNR